MWYNGFVDWGTATACAPASHAPPPRRPSNSRKIFSPAGSPLRKHLILSTRLESTLLQVLIPRHFNSFRRNTYEKPGGGHRRKPQSLATRHYSGVFRMATHERQQLQSLHSLPHIFHHPRAWASPLHSPGRPGVNSRYTTGSMLNTTVLDTNWLGRARSIAA